MTKTESEPIEFPAAYLAGLTDIVLEAQAVGFDGGQQIAADWTQRTAKTSEGPYAKAGFAHLEMEQPSLCITAIAVPKDGRFDLLVKAELLETVEVVRTGATTRAPVWILQQSTSADSADRGTLLELLGWAFGRFRNSWLAGTEEMLAADEQDADEQDAEPLTRYRPSLN